MSEACSEPEQTIIIGQGSYGIVYRGEWKGQPCAIKQFKNHPDIYWKQEMNALRAVQGHPNILPLLTSRKFEIVTPLYPSSLSSWHAKRFPRHKSMRYRISLLNKGIPYDLVAKCKMQFDTVNVGSVLAKKWKNQRVLIGTKVISFL
jgi:serine/threonine protein kinase